MHSGRAGLQQLPVKKQLIKKTTVFVPTHLKFHFQNIKPGLEHVQHRHVWFVRYDELCRGLLCYVRAAPWVPLILTSEWILKSRRPLNISHTHPFRTQLWLQLDKVGGARVYEPTIRQHIGGQSTALFTQDVETGWSQHPGSDSFNTCVLESVITSQSLVLGLNKDHKDCTYTVAGIHGGRHPPCSWTFHTCPLSLKAYKQLLLSQFKSLLNVKGLVEGYASVLQLCMSCVSISPRKDRDTNIRVYVLRHQ